LVPAGIDSPDTCNYPGNIWTKSVSSLDCLDVFEADLAWSQHDMCSWVEDTSSTYSTEQRRVYKSDLVTTTVTVIRPSRGAPYLRTATQSFLVSVSFKKQVTVLSSVAPVSVYMNEVEVVSVEVLGDVVYDVATQKVLAQVVTTANWPYSIDATQIQGWFNPSGALPAGGAVTVTVTADDAGQYVCDGTQDSECSQVWKVIIDSNAGSVPVCDLKGTLLFASGNVTCRDLNAAAPTACLFANGNPSVNFTIAIGHTSLCEEAALDATKDLKYDLRTYADAEFSAPLSVFAVGDLLYFSLVVSDTSTIDGVTITEVRVYDSNTHSDILYQQAAGVESYPSSSKGPNFNITQTASKLEITPGQTSLTAGVFKLNRGLDTLSSISAATPQDMMSSVTLEVTFDIAYHGNWKRTVRADFGPVQGQEQQHISIYFDPNKEAVPEENFAEMEDIFDWFSESGSNSLYASTAAVLFGVLLAIVI